MASARRTWPKEGVLFRGTAIDEPVVQEIRRLMALHRDRTQTEIARRVCRHFGWYRSNGGLADQALRAVLRRLSSCGLLRLPPVRGGLKPKPSPPPEGSFPNLVWPAVGFPSQHHRSDQLVVRPIHAGERVAWREYMARHHYLGHRSLVGESLCYVAFQGDQVVALIGWAAATLKNTPRDAYIGWDWETKCRRLSLVVNNIRFLVLPGSPGPNLASRVLAINLRRLSGDWQSRYGHRVFLAETFVDTSRFAGTCYRASNWVELGRTSGWSRQKTTYRRNGNPKSVFIYPLHRRARDLLNAADDPTRSCNDKEEARPLINNIDQLPIEGKGGLIDLLRNFADFRKARGVRHTVGSVLAFALCATLSGMRTFAAIAQWAKELPRKDQDRLGCDRHTPASEDTFRRVLGGVDAQNIDQKVGVWLSAQTSLKDEGIALDGKTLRGSRDGDNPPVQLLSALLHREGIVLAQHRVPDKTNEIPGVMPLLKNLSIEGAVVTGDAMHAQKATATHIVEQKKADYLFTVKDNQPTLRQHIADLGLGSFSPSGRNRR